MANGSVQIRIDGDASSLERELNSTTVSARSAAAALAQEYAKAGMSLSEAMTQAWSEVRQAQENGTRLVINGVETIIAQNDKIKRQASGLDDSYDPLADSAEQAADAVEDVGNRAERAGEQSQRASNRAKIGLADIKAGIDMITAAANKLASVAKKGVEYNATIEQYQTSFAVMTGSAEKAADAVQRLRVMGAETPFETSDLVSVTQLLMQYGFTVDDAIEKMSMLGDIAQGNRDAMVSIATGYAQMSSAGKVNLQDIKQMINGGFNPLQEISERTGESMESLYNRVSKGTIAMSEITDSLKAATSEGGKFYKSMEAQSKTLNGQLSTLKDNANELLGSITSGLSSELAQDMLPLVNNIVAELQSAFDQSGLDGLIDTATDMIPDLLGMMTGRLEDAISGLTRWLPNGINKIMAAAPAVIKGASSALPQITNALFDTASLVLTDLIGMLPELVPVLIDGVANVLQSVVTGIPKLVEGIFNGVEKAFHQGQQKVAGMWVDSELVAKYKFDVDLDMNDSDAKNEIAQSYASIRDALSTDLLTEEQKSEILGMLGDDAAAIKAKLKEFGLSDGESQEIADAISSGGKALTDALNALNVGVDASTLVKWMVQANGSNVALRHYARAAGLTDSQIDEIIGVYNSATGRLSSETPSIADAIYSALTDGLADDEETVSGLKDQVKSWSEAKLAEAEAGYNEAVAKLNPQEADYQTRLNDLKAQYDAATAEVISIRDASYTIIDNLAGQSTQSVENAYQTIADIETRVNALDQRIEEIRGKALEQAEAAYKVITAGGKADENTIQLAVALKFNEFQLDKQAAEDAYNKAVDELNDQLANNKITVEEYNTGIESAEAERQAAIDAATKAYEQAWGQILKGIAKSEGKEIAFDDADGKKAAVKLLKAIQAGVSEGLTYADLSEEDKKAVSEAISTLYDGAFSPSPEELTSIGNRAHGVIADALRLGLKDVSDIDIGEKAGEVLAAALNDGVTLAGTSFAAGDSTDQLLAIISSTFDDPDNTVRDAAQGLARKAVGEMSDKSGAERAGKETVSGLETGLKSGINKARLAGMATGKAYSEGYRMTMDIHSPSRVMQSLGKQTGKGLEIGLNESMKNAVTLAAQLMGGLTTSADLSRMTRVNMPELRQEITLAAEQSATPVNLDGHQIAKIQGQNNASQLAWLRARSARGYGQK